MTRERIEQLYYLNIEIMNDTEELVSLKSRARLGGVWHEGDEAYIAEEERRLAEKIERCEAERAVLERFIADIDDVLTRRIMHLRYEKGMSWDAVAFMTGGINTGEGVRKIAERFLEKTITGESPRIPPFFKAKP